MVVPILTTKLHLPSTPKGLVSRRRLITQLENRANKKLILISAPAGFGKTTLLAEWAQHCRNRCLVSWVHLDENDNELVRFLSYLIATMQVHQENLGEIALAGLGSTPPPPIEAVLTSLINDLDAVDDALILILDDYHLIDNAAIHEAVEFLIAHLPAHMCLVIATRMDPPLPIHLLRARGQLTELRVEDLRFTREESQSFLAYQLDLPLSAEDLTALDHRIEGWVAGLQMAAISLQGSKDVQTFVHTFSGSHRYIMDYLTEEIYHQQPPYIQKFLVKTAILDRLSGPLCDYVLEPDSSDQEDQSTSPPAQQTLEDLERANLFLIPLDEERVWYRYHHLFASLLRQRLRLTSPRDIKRLQRRASDWFAANGFYEEAFQYALIANDYQGAGQIVESQGLELLKKGTLSTLLGWLSRLPEEIIEANPRLNVIYAWVLLLTGQTVDIETYLGAAEENKVFSSESDELRGQIAAIRAYAAARMEDVSRTLAQANKAMDLLPEDDFSVRSVVSFVLGGIFFLQGEFSRAFEAMKEASQDGERSGNIHVAISALNAMAGILERQGKLNEAEEIYLQALQLGTGRSGRPMPTTASIYKGLARIYLARKKIQIARDYAQIGVQLGEQWMNADSQIHGLLTLAQVAHLEGNAPETQATLARVKQLAATHILTPGTAEFIESIEKQIKVGEAGSPAYGSLLEPLSERELEVLRLMSKGFSNPEIAAELIIALGTVKAHTSSIYRKLDVRSRTEAVIRATELGLS